MLRYEWLPHAVAKEADTRERYTRFILPTLTNPFKIWLTAYDDGSYRRRFIGLFAGSWDLMVVAWENRDGSLLWSFMQAEDKRMNVQRVGALLLYGQ